MFRWGIVGTGYVARKFVLGLRASQNGRATLVHSRTMANAASFAADFAIPEISETLEQAIRSPHVDAFYIATPPAMHVEQAIACLSAGKPVLVEKPFATTQAGAQSIADAARASGTFCMEGMWTRYMPLVGELRNLISEGAIGEPRSLAGSFGMANVPDASDNIFNAGLGGGALLHRGIYPLAMAFDILGPGELAGEAATIGVHGVDEDSVLIVRHASGALSTVRSSLRAHLANDVTIEGTEGTIHVHAPVFRPYRLQLTKTRALRARGGNPSLEAFRETALAQAAQQRLSGLVRLLRRGKRRTIIRPYAGNGYQYEADEVMRCVNRRELESALMPLSQSILLAGIMEKARHRWENDRFAKDKK